MRENAVEKSVRALTKKCGGVCWKWVSPGRAGVPDRVCLFPNGRIIFVETKRPGVSDGRSEQQKKVAGILEALGFEVWLINSVAAFKEKLKAAGLEEEAGV